MPIFDFNTQKMNTRLYGHTSGKEMFKVDEYNTRKKTTAGLSFFIISLLTIFYFGGAYIPTKPLIFMILSTIGLCIWFYFNLKQQLILRQGLY